MNDHRKKKRKRTPHVAKTRADKVKRVISAINGVPVIRLQLSESLGSFRGVSTFGFIKEIYSDEPDKKSTRYTRHNAGDRQEIRRKMEKRGDVFRETDAAMAVALPVAYLTSDMDLQRKAVTEVLYAVELAQIQKEGARNAGDCDQSDFWFGLQSLLHALAHLIEVWLDIKDGLPRRAWIHKVDAEDYLRVSRMALLQSRLDGGGSAAEIADQLLEIVRAMDKSTFPPMKFSSTGFTYTSAHCSVCGGDLSQCPHIEGRVYCGKYCAKVNVQNLIFDHVAQVEHPHDRRSIYLTSITDGVCRDTMTGQAIGSENDSLLATVHGRLTLLPDVAN